ncbi:Protein rer1a [Salvia divinorum]|uniref:Protein RER1 n=1 Tax=Salvia divinorum TaxID=28513 RepID=A0ABD1I7T2_SALDI
MNIGGGAGVADDNTSSSSFMQLSHEVWQRYQHLLDKSTPLVLYRWIFLAAIAAVDPEIQGLADGPALPTRASEEFRPFVRRLPEFKFWHLLIKAFCVALLLTFFSAFDVPVVWPILLFYWSVLFFLTMRRQIMHMIKYKYVPFTFGKQRYGKKAAPTDEANTGRP